MKIFLLIVIGVLVGLFIASGAYYFIWMSKIENDIFEAEMLPVSAEEQINDEVIDSMTLANTYEQVYSNTGVVSKTNLAKSNVPQDWTEYESSLANVKFRHPTSLTCDTRQTILSHPSWLQTICVNAKDHDPFVIIDTPYIDSGEYGDTFKLVSSEDVKFGGVLYTKKVYLSLIPEFYWGSVVYINGKSEQANSISITIPFGTKEVTSHKTQELAEKNGDALVSSLLR